MDPVEYLKSYKFGVSVGGKFLSVCKVSPIEVIEERHGNRKPRPITIEGAVRMGELGLSALVGKKGRVTVQITEYARDSAPARRITLGGCRFKRYRSMDKDTTADYGVVLESVTVHPTKIRFTRIKPEVL